MVVWNVFGHKAAVFFAWSFAWEEGKLLAQTGPTSITRDVVSHTQILQKSMVHFGELGWQYMEVCSVTERPSLGHVLCCHSSAVCLVLQAAEEQSYGKQHA
jgi:hypothetical protein